MKGSLSLTLGDFYIAPQARARRDSIDILATLLDILIQEGMVTKTRLMNQANLNPSSFKRYISLLENAGAVKRSVVDGRTVYTPTPRARLLRLILGLLLDALAPRPAAVNTYTRIYEAVEATLSKLGRVYRDDSGVYDYIFEKNGSRIGVLVAPENDKPSLVRLVFALVEEERQVTERLVVYTGGDEWGRLLRFLVGSSARVTRLEDLSSSFPL